MIRVYDGDKVRAALDLYPYHRVELDTHAWVADKNNVALEAEDGSMALFEYLRPHTYDGHYFFRCRGKDAVNLAKQVLEEVYTNYGFKAIRGFTPTKHKAALWMSRHLGFSDMGVVETVIGPCVLFVMNMDEHFKGTGL